VSWQARSTDTRTAQSLKPLHAFWQQKEFISRALGIIAYESESVFKTDPVEERWCRKHRQSIKQVTLMVLKTVALLRNNEKRSRSCRGTCTTIAQRWRRVLIAEDRPLTPALANPNKTTHVLVRRRLRPWCLTTTVHWTTPYSTPSFKMDGDGRPVAGRPHPVPVGPPSNPPWLATDSTSFRPPRSRPAEPLAMASERALIRAVTCRTGT
jgi:hypothetical protein